MSEYLLNLLRIGGFLFVVPFAFCFFILKGFPESRLSWVIIGFNLIVGFNDIEMITKTSLISLVLSIFGVFLIIFGESSLINRLFRERGFDHVI